MSRLRIKALLGGVAAVAAAMGAGGPAIAHGGIDQEQPSLRDLAAKSSLVIWGEVADIAYRNSGPTEEEPNGVPHTFVTYKVREALRGEAGKGEVVLRFIGGADGRGGVYMETTTPVFARGQSDILFVEGGALDDCPLVECVDGRFRVAGDAVYNAWGVPVVEARKNLVIGGRPNLALLKMELPRPSFDALAARPEMKAFMASQFSRMTADELRRRYDAEAPAGSVVSYEVSGEHPPPEKGIAAAPIRKFGKAMPAADFLATVRAVLKEAGAPSAKVQFADPKAPFTATPPKAQKFQAAAQDIKRSPVEIRELQTLNEGDDGPGTGPTRQPGRPTPTDRPQLQPPVDPPKPGLNDGGVEMNKEGDDR
ncbi:MAG: hypothetical protein ABL957_09220 [Parvularculaceae bacterium]